MAENFRLASQLVSSNTFWFEDQRVSYELALCALALDPVSIRSHWAQNWDHFQVSMGRPPRLGAFSSGGLYGDETRFKSELAPKSIIDAIGASQQKQSSADNAALLKMRDEDQAARTKDFSKMTSDDIQAMVEGDRLRQIHVRVMIDEGDVRTGNDFEAASLILQHGGSFADYRLAHELSVAAVALGNTNAI